MLLVPIRYSGSSRHYSPLSTLKVIAVKIVKRNETNKPTQSYTKKERMGSTLETTLTMVLIRPILMTTVDTEPNLFAPLAIGLTLTMDIHTRNHPPFPSRGKRSTRLIFLCLDGC
ncbi:hypothetical protein AAVH_37439, partial [Aphelenchoides avenae]